MSLRENTKELLSICLWVFEVLYVFSLISVVIWLSLKPKSPVYMITNVKIPVLYGRNSTFHYNKVVQNTSSIILDIEISNPNKGIGIYYGDINITFYHSDAIIGNNSLPGFYQGYKKSKACEVLVNVDKKFWRGITGRPIDMRVGLDTAVIYSYKIFGTKTKRRRMHFEVYVLIGSDGRISGETNIKVNHTIKLTKNGK